MFNDVTGAKTRFYVAFSAQHHTRLRTHNPTTFGTTP